MKINSVLLALGALLPLLTFAQETTIHFTSTVTNVATATATGDTAQGTPNTGYNGGNDNPVDPSTAGASGSTQGAFSLSKGALAAIITVVVVVALGGAVSAVLFWLAKKRQWDVRQSIRRASRRLTGRSDVSKVNRQNRRTGVRLNSPPPSTKIPSKSRDVEKGIPTGQEKGKTSTTISSQFEVETPTQKKGWKAFFEGKK